MKNVFYALVGSAVLFSCAQPKQEQQAEATPVVEAKPQPVDLADQKYVAMGKDATAGLASGDIAAWMKDFGDNARFYWSGGDSVIGKKAITDYWTDRRGKVIDKLVFSSGIWLPVKVNDPKYLGGNATPGTWLLSWYDIEATYKNGAAVKFRAHTDMHFDANDKIDIALMYFDRAPINAALAKKK
jgi:hypothetical protein